MRGFFSLGRGYESRFFSIQPVKRQTSAAFDRERWPVVAHSWTPGPPSTPPKMPWSLETHASLANTSSEKAPHDEVPPLSTASVTGRRALAGRALAGRALAGRALGACASRYLGTLLHYGFVSNRLSTYFSRQTGSTRIRS